MDRSRTGQALAPVAAMMETHQLPPLPQKPSMNFGPGAGAPKSPGKQTIHYDWTHAHMKYMPNEARKEAEEAILAAQAAASTHKTTALVALTAQGEAERRAIEADRQRKMELTASEDLRHLQEQEYEDRIHALERILEVERATNAAERQERERQAQELRDQCKLRVEHEQKRCSEVVRGSEARARVAEESADEARRRADGSISAARSREEARVKEVRSVADDRLRNLEAQHWEAMQRLQAEVAAERKALDEKNRMYLQQGNESVQESRRRIENNEKSMQIWMSTKEVQLAKKEGDWKDWSTQQKQQKTDFEKHHTQLLELEKEAHGRVMSRTMDRVVRSLQLGSDYTDGMGEAAPPAKGQDGLSGTWGWETVMSASGPMLARDAYAAGLPGSIEEVRPF